eukprot:gene11226-7981_t
MSEEAILSEELLAELGNDPNAVIVGKKRKQALTEEEKKIKYMPQEELKKFKKLSKKEQKKVLQREKKRERASKLGEYMDVIKANEISQEQRDMLQSSSQLNHTATLREQLTLLLKKERAGIKLTDEELDVLYPNRHQAADSDEAEDEDDTPDAAIETRKGSIKPSSVVLQPSPASNIVPIDSNNATEGDTLFSFTSLFKPAAAAPPSNSDSEDDARAAKKNSKKKKKKAASNDAPPITEVEEPSSSVSSVPAVLKAPVQPEEASTKPAVTTEEKKPFSAAGLGKNLLAQFSKIKEQKAAADSTSDDKDRKVSTIFSAEFDYDPHKPHAFVSNVPHHDDAALVATGAEPSKVVIAKKPLVEDTFFNYRRHMTIERPHQVAMDRMNLPVCQMEQEIVEAVHNHDVIILCGETGSGKSTQVPQFLYEAGYAQDEDHLIGIAQPRRVAVTSTAERVNFEMGSTLPALVGYQIRYDSTTVGSDTRVKFMTDGILLREISQDLLLRKYSVIILDEAHERNVNTDILLGMISRAIPLRKEIAAKEYSKWKTLSPAEQADFATPLTPLKLIIMSATLRVDDFCQERLFHPLPPIIKVEARQYPVTNHFAKRTEIRDYLQETFKKTCQIHERLPAGGVLKKIFAPVPKGHRLIVVATNVAETSITIPGIRYVVDSGRCKEKVLASASTGASDDGGAQASVYEAGITRYEVRWISKASADQRAGRAGRTGPGHCYRLFSSNFYHEHMQAFMPPEINVTPLEDIVLHMLSLGITEIESFPFPSNPPRAAVHAAVALLKNLGAIEPETAAMRAKERDARLWALLNQQAHGGRPATTSDEAIVLGHLSPLGKMLRWFPIHPRFAKMLVIATQTTQTMRDVSARYRLLSHKPINFLSRRRKFTAYVSGHPSLQTTGPVYVHPTSNCYAHDITLASETLPEYVVYTHMMKNQRGDCLYLTNVTVVSPQWITDVALTCPLVSIRHSDVMHQLDLASAASGQRSGPRYGVHLWTLPTTVLPMRYVLEHWHTGDASSSSTSSSALVTAGGTSTASSSAMPVGYRMEDLEFRWFARCLLFGQVMFPVPVPQLQRACLHDVHCIQQSKPHPKLLPVLRRLVEARVASRGALTQQLAQQSNFLAKELEALLKPDQQRGFRVAWMRLAQYAAAVAKATPPS